MKQTVCEGCGVVRVDESHEDTCPACGHEHKEYACIQAQECPGLLETVDFITHSEFDTYQILVALAVINEQADEVDFAARLLDLARELELRE